ncbi:hypothetical protein ACH5RR_026645 [Cinchona calisaya]|uniref:Transmembrane protein n=1 Tax=Cinchona calisaya TaxID=153742 RepID=A0ABD2Z358_9GENT
MGKERNEVVVVVWMGNGVDKEEERWKEVEEGVRDGRENRGGSPREYWFYNRMAGQENVKQLEECSVSNALGTWVFSVAGALLAIPVGIKRKSLAPLVFFGTTGTMLDIIMGISACEREHAERQMKLLEAQNAAMADAGDES